MSVWEHNSTHDACMNSLKPMVIIILSLPQTREVKPREVKSYPKSPTVNKDLSKDLNSEIRGDEVCTFSHSTNLPEFSPETQSNQFPNLLRPV